MVIGSAFSYGSVDPNLYGIGRVFSNFAAGFIPVVLYVIYREYTVSPANRLVIAILSVIPIATILLTITNPLHHMIWVMTEADAGPKFSIATDHKWFNRVQGRKFHRVELPLNWFDPGGPPRHVWTLFVHGPRFKPWGFLKRFTIEMGEQDMQFYSYTPVPEHDNEYRQAKWYEKDDCRRGRDIREDRALGI